jgi:hypothetical protein
MRYYIFNLKNLVQSIINKPIWLRYVLTKKIILDKYPNLDYKILSRLSTELCEYTKEFTEYQFIDGTEYIIHQLA